ncbi:hypothetical protein AcV7_003187 [Taiwanofungus camphoratus]|nr:hypothetical protein AcV7_003187 [Antrodia cinnamomea]
MEVGNQPVVASTSGEAAQPHEIPPEDMNASNQRCSLGRKTGSEVVSFATPAGDASLTNEPMVIDHDPQRTPRTSRKKSQKASLSNSPRSVGSGLSRATPAERLRERKLRDDPMAIVQNPQMVQCQRCGGKIKLSTKSSYDPFHWQKHRERCLRRSDVLVKELKENSDQSSYPTEVKIYTSSKRRMTDSLTPPLTPDNDDDRSSEGPVKEESPSLHLDDSPTGTYVSIRQPDAAFEEYLVRSRRRSTRELIPQTLESWQSWTWSQLKAPVYPGYMDYDDEDAIYSVALKAEPQVDSIIRSSSPATDQEVTPFG